MLQRILVAVVGIPLLLFVLIIAPDWATAALLCALCAVGAHELLAAACPKDITRRWWGLSGILGVTVILHTYLTGIGETGAAALMAWLLAAFLVLLFVSVVVEFGTPRALAYRDVCTILMAGIAIPLAFSCLMRLRLMEHGGGLVMIPLVAAFCSDSAALFAGMALGQPQENRRGCRGRPAGRYAGHGHFPHHLLPGDGGAAEYRVVPAAGPCGRGDGPTGRPELFCHQAGVRHQGLWPSAAGTRRCAGQVRQRDLRLTAGVADHPVGAPVLRKRS